MIVDLSAREAERTSPAKNLTPSEFFGLLTVDAPGSVQGVVFPGVGGGLTSHVWNKREASYDDWAAQKVQGRKPAYFTPAAYDPSGVSGYKGRTATNVKALRGLWIDVEGSEDKGGYNGGQSVAAALRDFIKATGLAPNIVVSTGSGGAHLYFLLEGSISREEWQPRAAALVALAGSHGFRIDAQVTTDAARVMRAPGSIHQQSGKPVTARRVRDHLYSLGELDQLLQYIPSANQPVEGDKGTSYNLAVNGDVIGGNGKFSYQQAARKCEAMRKASEDGGANTPYPVWILALKTADLSIEGRDFAHHISANHPDYDPEATDAKLNSLTGGPAGCSTWAGAYGSGGPCDTCGYRDRIKNPAVQLGDVPVTSPPGAVNGDATVPAWVVDLNRRFAVARVGSRMTVVDFETPDNTGGGKGRDFGYLDIAAFHTMFNGRFAPLDSPKDKPRPLSGAWLAHPSRRQYEGVVFAPGESLPPDILNTWQGFAVEAKAGDVTPWLQVLQALAPSSDEREYVLKWLAWKVQNPGGVPDTILIFRGSKGTGKNSLFDPVLSAFGRHAMLADDPELIAGRFTGHLMSLSFAVLDEAVFVGDPRQADRIKSRVTAKVMHYEQKGMDPVPGINRCAYVMLTNHTHVWQATTDERRAVVVDVGESLRGDLAFWEKYHTWTKDHGASAVLHHLQGVDLTGFNPRQIPKGEALRKQIELTALRDPAAAWWHQCLSEAVIRWRDGIDRVVYLGTEAAEIDRAGLRLSYEQSAAARGRAASDWAAVARKLMEWSGPGGITKTRKRTTTGREWVEVLAPLSALRDSFTEKTQVRFDADPR